MKCSRCGSENSVKNGFVNGCQRYKCKRCGCQFTRPDKRKNHLKERQLVALLYASGLSMNKIASIVGVSVQSVSRWLHSVYNNKNIDLPNVSPFKQIRYADILSYLAGLNEKELKRECIVLFSSLDSGCEISLLISKQKTEQQKGRP